MRPVMGIQPADTDSLLRVFQAFSATFGGATSLRTAYTLVWLYERPEGGLQRALQDYLDLPQTQVSVHIKRLRKAGLVESHLADVESQRMLTLSAEARRLVRQALTAAGVVLKTKK